MAQSLAELVDEITLDAYDIYEQLSGFLQVFSDEVTVPALGPVLHFPVEVTGFGFEGDARWLGLKPFPALRPSNWSWPST
jgi:hypothetical protein